MSSSLTRSRFLALSGAGLLYAAVPQRASAASVACAGNLNGIAKPDVDALHRRTVQFENAWASWLAKGGAKGYVGEVGWPGNDERWGHVAEVFYSTAAQQQWLVTGWVADGYYGTRYSKSFYRARFGPALDTACPQAAVVEHQTDPRLRGMNVGLDSPQEEYTYLAARGITYGRVQITWEQIQPTLYADLDYSYLNRLNDMIGRASVAGIKVIIDLHNYGQYNNQPITTNGPVQPGHLWDVWNRLAYHFAGDQRVYAYDLMNEPHDLDPAMWEQCTQHVAEGIRARADNHLISVSGLGWGGMQTYSQFHPNGPWMRDPNVIYTAHHYPDLESGPNSDYDTEVQACISQGY